MIRRLPSIGKKGLTPLALAVLCLLPASAAAESVTFVNETNVPLVVQMATAVRGGVRRDRPHQLAPGDKVRSKLPGNKLVNVYDARLPNRILYQGTIPDSTDDLVFSIQPDPRGRPKVSIERAKPVLVGSG